MKLTKRHALKRVLSLMLILIILSLSAVMAYAVDFDENNIMYSDKAGDLLCELNDREYYKAYDGWAIVAYFYCDSGYSGPILVSDTAESVAYSTSYDRGTVWESIGTVERGGKTYYYSAIKYFMGGNHNNEASHSLYKCNGGNKISVENAALELLELWCFEHQYSQWTITKIADCHSQGERVATCENCGHVETEVIEITHEYGEWSVTKEPACETEGEESRVCNKCQFVDTKPIDALNHKYGELTVVSGNMLIPPIVREKTCSVCDSVAQYQDWSYVWVTVLAAVGCVLAIFGLFNYVKMMRKTH